MSKIHLDMNVRDILLALSEGNPGAITVCVDILKEAPKIDPQALLGGVGHLVSLDERGIYGPRIWMLYKDVCGQDLTKTIAMLRAAQLGFLAKDKLDHAIDNYGEGVDVDDLLKQVRDRLEQFGRA